MRLSVRFLWTGIVVVAAGFHAGGAVETVTWTGGTGTWFTASHWSPSVVPNNGGGTNYWAAIDGGDAGAASRVDLNTAASIDRLSVDEDDELNLSPSSILTILENAMVVGTLVFEQNASTASDSTLRLDGNVTVDGGGTVLMTEFYDSILTSLNATNRLTNRCVIQGQGKVGNNLIWITNESVIEATTGTLEVNPSPGSLGVVNTGRLRGIGVGSVLDLEVGEYWNTGGLIEAMGGGRVTFAGGAVVDNDSGTIRAEDGSEVVFEGPAISGGVIEATGSGSGRTTLGTTTFQDLELRIPIKIEASTFLKLAGACTNVNGITFQNNVGTSSDSVLLIDGDVTLSPGLVSLTEQFDSVIRGTSSDARLTNGGTIAGRGQLGDNILKLVNEGTVRADVAANRLSVEPSSGAASVQNRGLMLASNGGILELGDGDYDNVGGEIQAAANSTVELRSDRIAGGILTSDPTGSIQTTGAPGILEDLELSEGRVEIGPSERLYLRGSIEANGQLLLVKNTGTPSDAYLEMDGDVVLSGSGEVRLTESDDSVVRGRTGSERLTNQATIAGAGRLGGNALVLVNEGVVAAESGTLTLDPAVPAGTGAGVANPAMMTADGSGARLALSGGTFENTGECRASDSGVLEFQAGAAITNTGGLIHAVTGGRIESLGATIVGGVVTGPVAAVSGSTLLQDVIFDGALGVRVLASTILQGGFANAGTVYLEENVGTASDAYLKIRDEVTVSGVGDIELREYPDCVIQGEDASDRLTNQVVIHGEGKLGINLLLVDNEATIRAEGGTLELDPAAPGDGSAGFRNGGLLQAQGAGAQLFLLSGTYDNNGGVIEASAGGLVRLAASSEVANSNGTLRALDASEVQLDNASVTGGIVATEGSGLVRTTVGTTLFRDVDLDGEVRIDAVTTLNVRERMRNDGLILFQENIGTSSDSRLKVDGTAFLEGTGTVRMTEALDSIISGGGPSDRLVSDNRIEGRGQLGDNAMMFTNRGTVDANIAGSILEVDPAGGADGVVNEGVLQSSSGGILYLAGGTFANGSGMVRADTGSQIDLACDEIEGGLLETLGTGRIRTTSAATTLDGVLANGLVEVAVGHTLQLRNTITNHGTILLVENIGTASDVRLQIDGPTILEGTGVVRMTERNDSLFRSATSGDLLTNRSTIEGEGNLGQNVMALANEGTLRATGSGSLCVDLVSGLSNLGTIEAVGSGGLEFREPVSNAGTVEIDPGSRILVQGDYVQTAGVTRVNGQLDPTGVVVITGGVLGGTGVVQADVDNAGVVNPGASTGSLAIQGAYQQDPGGLLQIEIGGTGAGAFDRLTTTGTAVLGGTLSVSVLGGFSPQIGDTFEILAFPHSEGAFSTELLPGIAGGARKFVVEYSGTNVVLSVADAVRLTYNQWKVEHFNPAEQADPLVSGPGADPEGDGIPNAVEYAFGFDPWSPDLVPVTIDRFEEAGAVFVTIAFPASTSASDAVFGVRSSADRGAWTVEATEEIECVPAGDFDEVTWKVLTPTDVLGCRFYELFLRLD